MFHRKRYLLKIFNEHSRLRTSVVRALNRAHLFIVALVRKIKFI
jgi:hypothetical protein